MLKQSTFAALLITATLLVGCGATPDPATTAPATRGISVTTRTVAELASLPAQVTYPGSVVAEQDVRVTAGASGVARGVDFQLGQAVTTGQTLLRIDDQGGQASAAALTQARTAAETARANLETARKNYESLKLAADKDLESAKLGADQQGRNVGHNDTTTANSIASARIALSQAEVAVSSARETLANRQALAEQSEKDTETNSRQTAVSVGNLAGVLIDGVNAITGFDDRRSVQVSYAQYFGALDATTTQAADTGYDRARGLYDQYRQVGCSTAADCLAAVNPVLTATKTMVDAVLAMLEKSVTASELPATSATGTSLASLKSTTTSYQTQINTAITQFQAAKQALENLPLTNKTTLDSLAQALAIAKQNESAARQNLQNLLAQTETTREQTVTSAATAAAGYTGTQARIRSQLESASSSVRQAELTYESAAAQLASVTGSRIVTAPITGTITKKSVAEGDAVNMGQLLFTVSQTQAIKFQVFVDSAHQQLIRVGDTAQIKNGGAPISAQVAAVAPAADPITRKFLIELVPDPAATDLPGAGGVVNVVFTVTYAATQADRVFVPLAATTIGQNESFIYLVIDGKAKRQTVEIARVLGEQAELVLVATPEDRIVIDGNRLLFDGAVVEEAID